MLVHTDGKNTRAKYISELYICRKGTSVDALRTYFNYRTTLATTANTIAGVNFYEKKEDGRRLVGSHLQSMVLTPHLHETSIGQFFDSHPEILAGALGSVDYIYENSFEWKENIQGNDDQFIRPDMLIRRADGYYDIVDFKTALLEKSSLTKAEMKRRRFIDGVNEGLAQLANYENYFQIAKNADYAMEKFKVQIKDPNLFLIVGNYDNASDTEIKEALRPFKQNTTVLDYDSIIQLYIANKKAQTLPT